MAFWNLGGSRFGTSGSRVHAKYCKNLAHLFATTLVGTTGALGAGVALALAETLDDASGALLGVEVLCCSGTELALLPNWAHSKMALLSATDPESPTPPAG